MKPVTLLLLGSFFFLCCASPSGTDDSLKDNSTVRYQPVQFTKQEKRLLQESLNRLDKRYDPVEAMLTKTIEGWNYHTDAGSGTFHATRPSLAYAIVLLDAGGKENTSRAIDIVKKVIALQDTDTASRTFGIWPYYLEEPLSTKKTPPDFNWADFNGVSLLDIFITHGPEIPEAMNLAIRKALINAARSIQKRNMGPGYTNISLMGSYVTFMTSHLFDIPDMQEYARKRIETFYNYTLRQGGFSEYNSPTYTIVALDVLQRMRMHITQPAIKPMLDSLYSIGWDMIARHYHKPSGQWAGPHSRAYTPLTELSFYHLLAEASGGAIKIDIGSSPADINAAGKMREEDQPKEKSKISEKDKIPNLKLKHRIPEHILPKFISPAYPRTEHDVFETEDPPIKGTAYLTDKYALATSNRSLLWRQRHPCIIYWGSPAKPCYFQPRFLHDFYDFSSAVFYSMQNTNKVLAAINFITNGGDRHVSGFYKLKEGKFKAKDIRLRFEFGNIDPSGLRLPVIDTLPVSLNAGGLQLDLQLFRASFGDLKGHWEKGGNEQEAWIDYVIYAGPEKVFDLLNMEEALLGFTFAVDEPAGANGGTQPRVVFKDGKMYASWNKLKVEVPVKPEKQPKHL